ncbi:UDP-glycosyltransferase UGT5 [Tribolium castaneum]|uniref:UDP-glycosyltransferase UGT5 n=1 Tax=Tribolium castaneum TaxID=7070 RepID=UPI0030FEA51A
MKFLLVLCCVLWGAQSYKLLFMCPMPSPSHFFLIFRLAKEFADGGHQVTVISPFPQKTPIKNYRDIQILEVIDSFEEIKKILFNMADKGPLDNLDLIYRAGLGATTQILENKNVQSLINSNETFDAFIIEQFTSEALLGIGHRFGAPIILMSGFGTTNLLNHFVANPAPSSYVWNVVMKPSTTYKNFWDRMHNFLLSNYIDFQREQYFMPEHRKLFKKYFNSDVELDDIVYNVSLILGNSHVSLYKAVPQVPNIINIGGFHVGPLKELPTDLQNFLDDAKNGVILFALGTNLKSSDLKPEIRDAFLNAFSKIKQKVLWKFEKQLDNLPENVKIMEWLPQQEVLAHPNVRAFITHGGMLSVVETVYFGVPMIGIPIFGDQKSNIATVAKRGYCINLPFTELTEEKLSKALNEILNNPKYRKNAQKLSQIMHDRPVKALDEAVFWIEHVIRHGGAPHLRTDALNLKWYQREMIDIIGFLLGVVLLFLGSILFILKTMLGWMFCGRSPVKQKLN